MLHPFDVHQPETLDEAVALRVSLGEDAIPYAGGTELVLAMKLGLGRWAHLIDVKRVGGLDRIEVGEAAIRIGAAATHHAISRHPEVARLVPSLAALEGRIANVRVRAFGTLGGNLAFAEPHADPPTLLLALGARVVISGPDEERSLGIDEFVSGAYETRLGPAELVRAIDVPIPTEATSVSYLNFRILERPSLGVAVVARVERGRFRGTPTVVVGAVDEVPRLVPAPELDGASGDDVEAAQAVAEAARRCVEPVGDLAGSAGFKRHLVGVLVRRALMTVAGDARAGAA